MSHHEVSDVIRYAIDYSLGRPFSTTALGEADTCDEGMRENDYGSDCPGRDREGLSRRGERAGQARPDIADGEFMVLVGPVRLRQVDRAAVVAGLEEVTGGTILIGGRVVNDLPPEDRDIAMVFQNYALYPHMTVDENIAFGLQLRKSPKEEIRRRVEEAAACSA